MQLALMAIGKMKDKQTRSLFEHYWQRLSQSSKAVGLRVLPIQEFAESQAATPFQRKQEEAARILKALPSDTFVIALDETGSHLNSEEFCHKIASLRDNATCSTTFVLGGPDGHGAAVQQRANLLLSFGAMTWPHQIARILLAEQLYRITTILAGHPYHRS